MTGCDGSHGSGCCTSSTPCGENEGDCDGDSDCFGNLKCGDDNCNNSTFSWWEDCCYDPAKGEFAFPDFLANLINIFTGNPCWNSQHQGQTIHPTEQFILMNLFEILCVVRWV